MFDNGKEFTKILEKMRSSQKIDNTMFSARMF